MHLRMEFDSDIGPTCYFYCCCCNRKQKKSQLLVISLNLEFDNNLGVGLGCRGDVQRLPGRCARVSGEI